MWSFKKELHKLSLHQLRATQNCEVEFVQDQTSDVTPTTIIALDGFTVSTTVSVEFRLTNILTADPVNSFTVSIVNNGTTLTTLSEGTSYIHNFTITPNGGLAYDEEFFIEPSNNHTSDDCFTLEIEVLNIGDSQCVDGNSVFTLGGQCRLERNLMISTTNTCPTGNTTVFYIETQERDWLQATGIRDLSFNLANAGYYQPISGTDLANQSNSRFWDGTQFTTVTSCP